MEMIQLMGTPSVDRQAQASLGKQSSAEMLDGGVNNEFANQLNTAISDGQKKEVNPNELIAPLVVPDLISGLLPKQLTEIGTEYTFNLSLGQVGSDSVDTQAPSLNGDISFSKIVKSVDSLVDQQLGRVGQSIKDFITGLGSERTQTQSSGVDADRAPKYVDGQTLTPAPPEMTAFDSASVDLATAIQTGVRNWIQRQVGIAETTVVATSPGFVDVTSAQPNVLGETTPDVLTEESDSTDVTPGILKKGIGQASQVSQAVVDQIVASIASGGVASPAVWEGEPLGFISKIPIGAKIGYRGTGQGRPDDLLSFDNGTPLGTNPNPAPKVDMGPLTMRENKPAIVDLAPVLGSANAPAVTIDPRELAKTPAKVTVEAETAPAIIEGLAGRLTRESFVLKPTTVTTAQAQTTETTQGQAQIEAQITVPVEVNQPLRAATRDRDTKGVAVTATIGDATVSTPTAVNDVPRTERVAVVQPSSNDLDEMDLLDSTDNGGSESNSVDGGFRADLAKSVHRSVEGRAVSTPKPEVETALDGAREKIAEAVMDLIAARRPQNIKVQLTPYNLGVIEVSVRTGGGRVDVDLRASDEGVRHGLAANRADLVRTIESGGTSVSSMNVGQHFGQDAGQPGHRGGDQATREDFQQAVNLGQVSTHAETLAVSSSSYRTAGNSRVDLAA